MERVVISLSSKCRASSLVIGGDAVAIIAGEASSKNISSCDPIPLGMQDHEESGHHRCHDYVSDVKCIRTCTQDSHDDEERKNDYVEARNGAEHPPRR